MTDADLSRQLALALGWKISHVTSSGEVHVCIKRGNSRKFSYTDPTVCLPLLDWLLRDGAELWRGASFSIHGTEYFARAPTLEEAVARAVITVKGGA